MSDSSPTPMRRRLLRFDVNGELFTFDLNRKDATTADVTLVHWGTKTVPDGLPMLGIMKVLSQRFGTDNITFEHSQRSVGCEVCGHGHSAQTVFAMKGITKGAHYV